MEHLARNVQGSFKRPAPLMGNRSLESRNSKRAQYHPQNSQPKKDAAAAAAAASSYQPNSANSSGLPSPNMHPPAQPITVGALEVQNVKKAINRYGTLPKGARIGAYLGMYSFGLVGLPPARSAHALRPFGNQLPFKNHRIAATNVDRERRTGARCRCPLAAHPDDQFAEQQQFGHGHVAQGRHQNATANDPQQFVGRRDHEQCQQFDGEIATASHRRGRLDEHVFVVSRHERQPETLVQSRSKVGRL